MPGFFKRIRSRLQRVNWRRACFNYARKSGWSYKHEELEIFIKFLKLIEDKLRSRLWMDSGVFSFLQHLPGSRRFCTSPDEDLFRTACHEAGHLVCHWFSGSPRNISHVTILPSKGCCWGSSKFTDCENDFAKTPDNFFSYMCVHIGGEMNAGLMSSDISLEKMTTDLIWMSRSTYEMANMTLEQTGEKDLIQQMWDCFWQCYFMTDRLLREHLKEAQAVAYALYVEKNLHISEVLNILGPKPQLQKSLYEGISSEILTLARKKDTFVSKKFSRSERREKRCSGERNYGDLSNAVIDFRNYFLEFSDPFLDGFGLSLLFDEQEFFGSSCLDPSSRTVSNENSLDVQ